MGVSPERQTGLSAKLFLCLSPPFMHLPGTCFPSMPGMVCFGVPYSVCIKASLFARERQLGDSAISRRVVGKKKYENLVISRREHKYDRQNR